jgi:hypothetical protein
LLHSPFLASKKQREKEGRKEGKQVARSRTAYSIFKISLQDPDKESKKTLIQIPA